MRLICNENKFTHAKPLMRSLQVLNIFLKTKIEKIPVIMYRVKTCGDVPNYF